MAAFAHEQAVDADALVFGRGGGGEDFASRDVFLDRDELPRGGVLARELGLLRGLLRALAGPVLAPVPGLGQVPQEGADGRRGEALERGPGGG